jgi:predicted transcriptional regulator of viral defense system
MIILDFIERMKPVGVFSRADIEVVYPDLDPRRLYEWQLKGYILKLRNSWYCLPDFLKEPYSTWIIANKVHAPSYISMESALSFYGILPEGVHMSTSVCTNRTLRINMAGHEYEFSRLREKHYRGYRLEDTGTRGLKLRIASPEKAVADFFYFRTSYNSEDEIRELRFNEASLDGGLDREKLRSYTKMFETLALEKRIGILLKLLGHA